MSLITFPEPKKRRGLNAEDVRKIRWLAANTDVTVKEIAFAAGVRRQTIDAVIQRISWANVD